MLGYDKKRIKFGPRAYHGKQIRQSMLPEGLTFHCDSCKVVVPADAPRPEGGNCMWVAQHRIAPFKPHESLAGQFTMAAAAWGQIYDEELKANTHGESTEYNRRLWYDRKAHFGESAVRAAMQDHHVAADRQHGGGRDAWLFD